MNNKYQYSDLPARLVDNVQSGYSSIYTWEYAVSNFNSIVEQAFENRIKRKNKINNSRQQMQRNT